MEKGAKLVSSAILGIAFETVIINGKVYMIYPPTIKKIAGAGMYLSNLGEGKSAQDVLETLKDVKNACSALSWFIAGDESLVDELAEGTLEEVVEGLSKAISLMGIENFIRLSSSARSVRTLIAKER